MQMNDRNREFLCVATNSVPQLRADAASANIRKNNGSFVRLAVIGAERGERLV